MKNKVQCFEFDKKRFYVKIKKEKKLGRQL